MKNKALAIVLALCMALAMLPAVASAAAPAQPAWEVYTGAEITMSPTLEPAEFEPMVACDGYDLQVYTTEGGTVLYEVVDGRSDFILYTEPDDGYYLEGFYVEYSENAIFSPSLDYAGMGCYEGSMPDSDLKITAIFTELSGPTYDIDLHIIGDKNGGNAELSITQGQMYETIYVYVEPAQYHLFTQAYGIFGNGTQMDAWEGGGSVAEPKIVELVVPDDDMDVYVEFLRYGPYSLEVMPFNDGGTISVPVEKAYYGEIVPITIIPDPGYRVHYIDVSGLGKDTASIAHAGGNVWNLTMGNGKIWIYISFAENINPVTVTAGPGGTASANVTEAKEGDTVTLTCTPDEGYRVDKITGVKDLTDNGDGTYSFTMPGKAVEISVTFKSIYNPVTVTVDTGLGGTAAVDLDQAKAGDTVTLTCAPEEGYRVAQITGADVTDNGDGTYSFTMPDAPVELHVLFLRQNNPFLDVNETHFFHDPVLWAVENGITNGIDDTHFGPFLNTNRAAVVTMLWRWAGSPEPTTTENPFTDVPADIWYTKPVLWAVENGITNGLTVDTFGPNAVCNRAQVVTFLYRYLNASVPEGTENPFVDVPAGEWYEAPVLWALANGVTTGADATHFDPNGNCLRAQFVTFLYRAKDIPVQYDLSWNINGFNNTPSERGTVTLSHTKAAAGEVITATVVPNEGYVLDWAKCYYGTPVTQVSDTEFTFVMPAHEEYFGVNFSEAPEEPEPTDPTDPTDPEEPEPTDPEEPETVYDFVLKDNGFGKVSYRDGVFSAAPGESIFFYAVPNDGYYLSRVEIFNPNNEIDISKVLVYSHGDDLYELVMIDHDVVMTCVFEPIPNT